MSILQQPDAPLLAAIIALSIIALISKAAIRYWQNSFRRRDEAFSKAPPMQED